MSRLARALLGATLVAAFALTGLGTGAGSAAATALPIGQCTTSSGVVLAVDFSHWGGPMLRSCGTTPTTGYTLLNQGGWATTGTRHDGPAFICRIGYSGYQGGTQYPTSATDTCNLTPPASAYWSYWHANPGQNSWSYSQLGAMSYHPEPGSVDLWVFGQTNVSGTSGSGVPSFSPDTLRAHNTSPSGGGAPPASHSTAPPATNPSSPAGQNGGGGSVAGGSGSSGSGGGSRSSNGGGGSSGGTSHGATGTTSAPGSTTSTSGSSASKASASKAGASASSSGGSGSPGASSPGSGPSIFNAEPTAAAKHSTGSFVPGLVTGLLVLAIAGVAGFTGWRRRQAR